MEVACFAVKCSKEKEVSDVFCLFNLPTTSALHSQTNACPRNLESMKGASSHETALRHVLTPTGFQNKPVLKEHYFGKEEQFSVAVAP